MGQLRKKTITFFFKVISTRWSYSKNKQTHYVSLQQQQTFNWFYIKRKITRLFTPNFVYGYFLSSITEMTIQFVCSGNKIPHILRRFVWREKFHKSIIQQKSNCSAWRRNVGFRGLLANKQKGELFAQPTSPFRPFLKCFRAALTYARLFNLFTSSSHILISSLGLKINQLGSRGSVHVISPLSHSWRTDWLGSNFQNYYFTSNQVLVLFGRRLLSKLMSLYLRVIKIRDF